MARICLGGKLKAAKSVRCIPFRYNWSDFTSKEKGLILEAERIYFPTIHYAPVFNSLGKDIFPSISSYMLLGNKILQTQAFSAASIPMPRTRLFTGRDRLKKIQEEFSFPLVAKVPVASSRGKGVSLVKSRKGLKEYLGLVTVAYIQEYIPIERDVRVVVIGRRAVLSYWKVAATGKFQTNVFQGGEIEFENVPDEAVELALLAANRCNIDHAGFDICMSERGPLVLEANIHFGREGFKKAGVSYRGLLSKMADSGQI